MAEISNLFETDAIIALRKDRNEALMNIQQCITMDKGFNFLIDGVSGEYQVLDLTQNKNNINYFIDKLKAIENEIFKLCEQALLDNGYKKHDNT